MGGSIAITQTIGRLCCLSQIVNHNVIDRHPVHNQYLPAELESEKYLLKEGDMSGKRWDEEALVVWEAAENGGERWEGRT